MKILLVEDDRALRDALEEPMPEEGLQQEEEQKKISTGTLVLIGLCVTLTAGLVLQGTLLTRKLHRMEEEKL